MVATRHGTVQVALKVAGSALANWAMTAYYY